MIKTDKVKVNQFISNCFTDCDRITCIALTIVCKLLVFTGFVSVITYSIGYLIQIAKG